MSITSPRFQKLAAAAVVLLAGVLSALLGLLLWLIAAPLTAAYTDDREVQAVALGLLGYVAGYQIFDAVQTIAAYALRGYRITFAPMFVHLVCFWGIGLLGGWWLAFHAGPPMGAAGFWLASLLGLLLAALLLGALLWRALRAVQQ